MLPNVNDVNRNRSYIAGDYPLKVIIKQIPLTKFFTLKRFFRRIGCVLALVFVCARWLAVFCRRSLWPAYSGESRLLLLSARNSLGGGRVQVLWLRASE